MDRKEKIILHIEEDHQNLINIISICLKKQDKKDDLIQVAEGELVLPFKLTDKWLWVRSLDDIGVYPRELLVPAAPGTFLLYPETQKCPFCNLALSRTSYVTHVRKYPGGDCYSKKQCDDCKTIFKFENSYRKHVCEKINFFEVKCMYCNQELSNRKNLKYHKQRSVCMPRCDVCNNPCRCCLIPEVYGHFIFENMDKSKYIDLDEFVKLTRTRKKFKELICKDRNFSSWIKYMRNAGAVPPIMKKTLLKVIKQRWLPFETLQNENVLFMLLLWYQFWSVGAILRKEINYVVNMTWGVDSSILSRELGSLQTVLFKKEYEANGGQKRKRSSSPEERRRSLRRRSSLDNDEESSLDIDEENSLDNDEESWSHIDEENSSDIDEESWSHIDEENSSDIDEESWSHIAEESTILDFDNIIIMPFDEENEQPLPPVPVEPAGSSNTNELPSPPLPVGPAGSSSGGSSFPPVPMEQNEPENIKLIIGSKILVGYEVLYIKETCASGLLYGYFMNEEIDWENLDKIVEVPEGKDLQDLHTPGCRLEINNQTVIVIKTPSQTVNSDESEVNINNEEEEVLTLPPVPVEPAGSSSENISLPPKINTNEQLSPPLPVGPAGSSSGGSSLEINNNTNEQPSPPLPVGPAGSSSGGSSLEINNNTNEQLSPPLSVGPAGSSSGGSSLPAPLPVGPAGSSSGGSSLPAKINTNKKRSDTARKSEKRKKKPKQCDNCQKILCDATALRHHKNKCNKIYPYKCSVCGKGFAQPNGLKYHSTVHNKNPSQFSENEEKKN